MRRVIHENACSGNFKKLLLNKLFDWSNFLTIFCRTKNFCQNTEKFDFCVIAKTQEGYYLTPPRWEDAGRVGSDPLAKSLVFNSRRWIIHQNASTWNFKKLLLNILFDLSMFWPFILRGRSFYAILPKMFNKRYYSGDGGMIRPPIWRDAGRVGSDPPRQILIFQV